MVWSRNSKGPTSDRIQTNASGYRPQVASSLSNVKGPKSEDIRRLEVQLHAIRTSTGLDKDPKGGCFCQAREHAVSSHTPICRTCGLILCMLNEPYYACPHCSSLLLTSLVRISLEERFERLISDTLTKEAEERQRAIAEAHRAAGAFPSLPGTSTPSKNTGLSNQMHKVMSLNTKTKQMTISSFTPASSRPHTPQQVDEEFRVPPSPVQLSSARRKPDANGPCIARENARYIPTPRTSGEGNSQGTGKTKQKSKERAKGSEGSGS